MSHPARWSVRAWPWGGALLLTLLLTCPGGADVLERSAVSAAGVDVSGAAHRLRASFGEAGIVLGASDSRFQLGGGFWSGHFRLVATGVPGSGLDPDAALSWANTLRPGFPNPFRGSTALSYSVAAPSRVALDVFDVRGRRVVTLIDQQQEPGLHRAPWDGRDAAGRDVASGIYFYRLRIGSWSDTKKILKLH